MPYTYQGSHDHLPEICLGGAEARSGRAGGPTSRRRRSIWGLSRTLSVTEYPPYLVARLVNTLDHVTEGRVGWNIVTGSNDGGAQNYGMERQFPHDERYDRADEFAEIVTRLWESWDADAVVNDRSIPMFADGSKVHPIHYEGRYFKCRGPLNAPRSPQVRPVLCQAGGSPRGQAFAARWADTIIAAAGEPRADEELPGQTCAPARPQTGEIRTA